MHSSTVCKGHDMQDWQLVQFLFHVQIVITYQSNAVYSAMTPVILSSLILILCSPRRVDSTTASKLFQKTSVTEFSSVSSSSTPASEVITIQRMSLISPSHQRSCSGAKKKIVLVNGGPLVNEYNNKLYPNLHEKKLQQDKSTKMSIFHIIDKFSVLRLSAG